jgi:hypothetical protein
MFDVFYLGENPELLDHFPFAKKIVNETEVKPNTNMYWLIESGFRINDYGVFQFRPPTHDQKYHHVWQCYEYIHGGVHLKPKQRSSEYKLMPEQVCESTRSYPVHLVSDPGNLHNAIPESWMIDSEYQIDYNITWLPSFFERHMIHVFHINDQLRHKYPAEMGGVYWYPADPVDAPIKIHDSSPFKNNVFDRFESKEHGQLLSKTDWFWVVEPEVEVLPGFDFNFIPAVWDAGKIHVWQKLHPITHMQYDYGGVVLYPRISQQKGRPKYMREPACVQREYPVYYLESTDYLKPLSSAYQRFSKDAQNQMFWVVDAFTEIAPDFNFDYYPTQWDSHCVHVFKSQDGEYKNVRLVPVGLFETNEITDNQIANNSFENLKLIDLVASSSRKWPLLELSSFDSKELTRLLAEYHAGIVTGKPEQFVWTLDPGLSIPMEGRVEHGFSPRIPKLHCWQKINDITGKTHSYGGLRLWPTGNDYSALTSEDLRLNRFRDVQYVREPGCTINVFDVVFISYNDADAASKFAQMQVHVDGISTQSKSKIKLHWVKDVAGIFNAHKAAAQLVSSRMFWVVDADAELVPEFNFGYIPDVYDEQVVHVWHSVNPVTGDEYGYGGVKLFPTQLIRDATSWGLDFTTGLSSRFKVIPEVSCVTRFNTDQFSTWRSAFREAVKLTLLNNAESLDRLRKWLNPVLTADFAEAARLGAKQGNQFAIQHRHDAELISNINNFHWLTEYYHNEENKNILA